MGKGIESCLSNNDQPHSMVNGFPRRPDGASHERLRSKIRYAKLPKCMPLSVVDPYILVICDSQIIKLKKN